MLKNILPSNRNFGIVFFIVFLIVSFWPLLNDGNIRFWSLIVSIVFLILGVTNSKLLTPLNKIWFHFGILLGKFISPIVMGIVFFLVITPISILLKLFNKDILNIKKKQNTKSYWIKKPEQTTTMRNQF
jgi:hypothetical protein|tara:strand:+ start:421 stop:807 length:387 start_codon:yes stop_codon:yes gene_type:complete